MIFNCTARTSKTREKKKKKKKRKNVLSDSAFMYETFFFLCYRTVANVIKWRMFTLLEPVMPDSIRTTFLRLKTVSLCLL